MTKTIKTGCELDQFQDFTPIKGKDLKENQLFTNESKKRVYVAFEGVALRFYEPNKSIVINPGQTYYLINKLF